MNSDAKRVWVKRGYWLRIDIYSLVRANLSAPLLTIWRAGVVAFLTSLIFGTSLPLHAQQRADVEEANPGFETLQEETESPSEVEEVADNAESPRAPGSAPISEDQIATTGSDWVMIEKLENHRGSTIALLLLFALLVVFIAWRLLRKRPQSYEFFEEATSELDTGIGASTGEDTLHDAAPQEETEEPEPTPEPSPNEEKQPLAPRRMSPRKSATKPLNIDLSLDIMSASRSVMQLSVEFSLEIFNRSDAPIHGLTIAAELASANEGASAPAPVDKTRPIDTIDRLAPQQSGRVKGYLELPTDGLSVIQQGGHPFYIPLVHLRIAEHNQPAIKRTFVLGSPSASSATRIQPLPFDAPPGRLPPLRAQLITRPA